MHCLTKTKVPNQNSIEMSPLYNIVQALQTKFNPENIKSDLEWTHADGLMIPLSISETSLRWVPMDPLIFGDKQGRR